MKKFNRAWILFLIQQERKHNNQINIYQFRAIDKGWNSRNPRFRQNQKELIAAYFHDGF